MERSRASRLQALIALAAAASSPLVAQAQTDWPRQPSKIMVGFAPGGGNDVMSRVVGQKLSERLGQPVLVENRPGANGFIAAELVVRAPPDGYTLFSATTGTMVIAPSVYTKLPYDPLKSFVHLGITAAYPLVLVVDASRGIKSIADLVTYTKANPDKSNYGSTSPLFQLPTELFKTKTGARLEHIPFKGSTETATGMLTGQVLAAIIDPAPVLTHVKSGKLRLLATTGETRFAELPETPTLKEEGVDLTIETFMGFVAPAGTPPAVIKRYETALAEIRKMPDVAERLRGAGMPVAGSTAQDMKDTIAREIPLWTAVAKTANVKLD